jgi:hypothetical protein
MRVTHLPELEIKKMPIVTMETASIIQREPFLGLFPLNIGTIASIEDSIESNGYDEGAPITVWKGENVCIDGHQRLKALETLRAKTVPVVLIDFKSEKDAMKHAIRMQRDRRNMTDIDLLSLVERVDERKAHGASDGFRGNQHSGGKGPDEPLPESPERTAEITAKVAGTSPTKVKKIRNILDNATPEILSKVRSGEMSISQASNVTTKMKKQPKIQKKETENEQCTTEPDDAGDSELRTNVQESFDQFYSDIVALKGFAKNEKNRGLVRGCLAKAERYLSGW